MQMYVPGRTAFVVCGVAAGGCVGSPVAEVGVHTTVDSVVPATCGVVLTVIVVSGWLTTVTDSGASVPVPPHFVPAVITTVEFAAPL